MILHFNTSDDVEVDVQRVTYEYIVHTEGDSDEKFLVLHVFDCHTRRRGLINLLGVNDTKLTGPLRDLTWFL